jgi:hypothetical protein
MPQMKFLCDVTIGEGESVAPRTKFVKTWRIKNSGAKRWPFGCHLKLVNGYNLGQDRLSVTVSALMPDEQSDVSIELQSPETPGIYQSQYKLFTANNSPFGDPIWLLLNVEEGGVLGITQQLNSVNMFNPNAVNYSLGAPRAPASSNNSIFALSSSQSPPANLNNSNSNNNNSANFNFNVFNSQAATASSSSSTSISSSSSLSKSPLLFSGGAVVERDSNSNYIHNNNIRACGQKPLQSVNEQTQLQQQEQSPLSNLEEKRPDFYDDMFS